MIDKYYNGVIEQVVSGIGNVEHNSILVRYSNDFSIWDLESVNHYKNQSDIFFTCHEFSYNKIAEAYEPADVSQVLQWHTGRVYGRM